MNDFHDIFDITTMHHAQCIVGDVGHIHTELRSFVEALHNSQGVDVQEFMFDTLTIQDAHTLALIAATKPVTEQGSISLVTFSQTTHEAQNALLKSIEEPAAGVRFIFIIPHVSLLLPTVQSRCIIHYHHGSRDEAERIDAKTFLDMSPKDRMASIETVLKDKDESFSRTELVIFLNTLEKEISSRDKDKYRDLISEIYTIKPYVQLSGCSVKMILEYIACIA